MASGAQRGRNASSASRRPNASVIRRLSRNCLVSARRRVGRSAAASRCGRANGSDCWERPSMLRAGPLLICDQRPRSRETHARWVPSLLACQVLDEDLRPTQRCDGAAHTRRNGWSGHKRPCWVTAPQSGVKFVAAMEWRGPTGIRMPRAAGRPASPSGRGAGVRGASMPSRNYSPRSPPESTGGRLMMSGWRMAAEGEGRRRLGKGADRDMEGVWKGRSGEGTERGERQGGSEGGWPSIDAGLNVITLHFFCI